MSIKSVIFCFAVFLLPFKGYSQNQTTPTNSPIAELTEKVSALEKQKAFMSDQIQQLTRQVADMSNQLGPSRGSRSSFNTINQRLTDMERRLDRLERDMNRYDSRR